MKNPVAFCDHCGELTPQQSCEVAATCLVCLKPHIYSASQPRFFYDADPAWLAEFWKHKYLAATGRVPFFTFTALAG